MLGGCIPNFYHQNPLATLTTLSHRAYIWVAVCLPTINGNCYVSSGTTFEFVTAVTDLNNARPRRRQFTQAVSRFWTRETVRRLLVSAARALQEDHKSILSDRSCKIFSGLAQPKLREVGQTKRRQQDDVKQIQPTRRGCASFLIDYVSNALYVERTGASRIRHKRT